MHRNGRVSGLPLAKLKETELKETELRTTFSKEHIKNTELVLLQHRKNYEGDG